MAGLVVFGVIGAVVAWLAYRESEAFRRTHGVTPWRMPSWAWALIGFGSLLICAVLLAIARRTTAPVLPAVPPGWHPDPYDPRQLRYWDGSAWTGHVSAPPAHPLPYAPPPLGQ